MKKSIIAAILIIIVAVVVKQASDEAAAKATTERYRAQEAARQAERDALVNRLMPMPGTPEYAERQRTEALQKIADELERANTRGK